MVKGMWSCEEGGEWKWETVFLRTLLRSDVEAELHDFILRSVQFGRHQSAGMLLHGTSATCGLTVSFVGCGEANLLW